MRLPRHIIARAAPAPAPVRGDVSRVTVAVPVRTESEPNRRDHFHAKARRVRLQRDAVALCLSRTSVPPLPVAVTLTRIAPRAFDSDNAVASLKAVRDEVAAVYGVRDDDPRIAWHYGDQEHAASSSVRIDIRRLEEPTP